jgi:exodeoxyribonuclease VII large subunit
LAELETRLRLLAPQAILDRGYSLTLDAETGRVVRNAAEIRSGTRLRTRLQHGEVTSVATRAVVPEPDR